MTHRIKLIVLSLMAIGLAGCAASDHDASLMAKPMWKNGEQKLAQKHKAADPKTPKILPKTHFAAARLLERQGLIHESIVQYRKAVAVNHEFVEGYHLQGSPVGSPPPRNPGLSPEPL